MASFGSNAVHAWARVNQSGSQTLVDSYNITSIADNTTGKTTFNFSTNASDDDYVYACCAGNVGGTTTSGRAQNPDQAASVSSIRIRNFNVTGDALKDDTLLNLFVISQN